MCGTPTQANQSQTESSAGCSCCAPREQEAPDTVSTAGAGTVASEFLVVGMTCGHCVATVSTELGKLDGVADVVVSLVPGGPSRVTVRATGPVSREAAAGAVREAGYELATA